MRHLTIDVPAWLDLTRESGVPIPVSFQVVTGSMKPLIRPKRDTVTVYPLSSPLSVGDIVLFEAGGRYCLHRVFKLSGNTVITRGDNCKYPDAPMPLASIAGVAVSVDRDGKIIRLDTKMGRNAMLLSRLLRRIVRTLL